jgi:two-component system sensor histidine kinase AlgZ
MNFDKPDDLSIDERLQLIPNLCRVQSLLILVVFAELLVLVLTLYSSKTPDQIWDAFGTGSLYIQWVVILIAFVLCRIRAWLARLGVYLAYLIAYLVTIGIHLGIALCAQAFLSSNLQQNWDWHWVLKVQTIAALVSLLVLHYFYVQYRVRQQEQAELRLRVDALQSRIQPHFLFNSMNSIASLVDSDPESAESAIVDLSELFRASLKESGTLVALSRELKLCEGYLRIEKLRLGKRLQVNWVIKIPPERYAIPLLTLQPLIENAIIHGIQKRLQGGDLRIRVFSVADELLIDVRNPLPDLPADSNDITSDDQNQNTDRGNHMALDNIRDRLEALFPQKAKVSGQKLGAFYVSTLRIPLTGIEPASPSSKHKIDPHKP